MVRDFFFHPVDSRIYALLRIAFGISALANIIQIWPDRIHFLSQQGWFDGEFTRRSGLFFSVFHLISSAWLVTLLVMIAFVVTCCLTVGFYSRAAAIGYYIWQLSFTNQALPTSTGYDGLFRTISFIFLFSPLGMRWSVDAILAAKKGKPVSITEPAYGLQLVKWQVAVMYVVTVTVKIPDTYWQNGEYWSYFGLSTFSAFQDLPFAHWTNLSRFLTHFALLIEYVLPFFLWTKKLRYLGLFLGCGLHINIAIISPMLTVFSMIVMASYLAFLDDDDMQRILRSFSRISGKVRNHLPK
jgi:hypothetical protein